MATAAYSHRMYDSNTLAHRLQMLEKVAKKVSTQQSVVDEATRW